MSRHDADPITLELADATSHLLSVVSERLETHSTAFLRRLGAEGLTPALLVDAGRIGALAELLDAEAEGLERLLLEAADGDG